MQSFRVSKWWFWSAEEVFFGDFGRGKENVLFFGGYKTVFVAFMLDVFGCVRVLLPMSGLLWWLLWWFAAQLESNLDIIFSEFIQMFCTLPTCQFHNTIGRCLLREFFLFFSQIPFE